MRYCIRYSKSSQFRHMEDIDEIEVVYNRADLSLPEFIEKYQDKTIVIIFVYLFITLLPSSPPSLAILSNEGITIANN